ncbi:dTDP-4-dehydrorhamnose reductase [Oscillochloris trichoides DG-6]|uniref:dTDP-4-dehydrorhamnose reductase n=1 Tax=Oscillochloris trichoides DG-6 TaxID=765420 RepID=E1IB15_9CHLR|nr:SDR family oxidoreductase [Oscillochloris trichoides]EFO81661.1 dTDP-4-dehydrorhamnose reductase [Oscillochloris trichoides DG-6]
MAERIFITGGTGYLGTALLRQLELRAAHVGASYLHQPPTAFPNVAWVRMDLREPEEVRAILHAFQPTAIIHTAFVQYEPDLLAITGYGSGLIAEIAASLGARLIHMSSDVIFDGERTGPYTENDAPNPISAYGEAKALAERLVQAAYPAATLVRTSLIYGFAPIDRQTRFALEIAAGQRSDRLFSDEYRCPIFVDDLAAALIELLNTEHTGVLNIAGAERVSRYELGCLLAQALGYNPDQIQAGRSAELPVRRPRNCSLDISRAQALLHTRLRGVREVLAEPLRISHTDTNKK